MIFIILFQIIISEIMTNPEGSEQLNEFVEIYNSGKYDFDISGLEISDGFAKDKIILFKGSSILKAGEYAVVMDPGYFNSDRIYGSSLDELSIILTIDNSSFGQNGFSNSKSEKISLILFSDTLDVFTTNTKSRNGYSFEKRVNYSKQWMQSFKKGGSPGYKNSVDKYLEFISFKDVKKHNNEFILSFINQNNMRHEADYIFEIHELKENEQSIIYNKQFTIDVDGNEKDNKVLIFEVNQNKFSRIKLLIKNIFDDTLVITEINSWPKLSFFPFLFTFIKTTKDQNFQIKNVCPYTIFIDTIKFKTSRLWKEIPVNQFLAADEKLRFSKHDTNIDGIYNEDIPFFYSKNMKLALLFNNKIDSISYQIIGNDFNSSYESLIPRQFEKYNHQMNWLINPSIDESEIYLKEFSITIPNQPVHINSSKVIFQLNYSEYDIIKLSIYNINGQLIKKISRATYFAVGDWVWDGKDKYNDFVETGVYILVVQKRKIKSGEVSIYKKAFVLYK